MAQAVFRKLARFRHLIDRSKLLSKMIVEYEPYITSFKVSDTAGTLPDPKRKTAAIRWLGRGIMILSIILCALTGAVYMPAKLVGAVSPLSLSYRFELCACGVLGGIVLTCIASLIKWGVTLRNRMILDKVAKESQKGLLTLAASIRSIA